MTTGPEMIHTDAAPPAPLAEPEQGSSGATPVDSDSNAFLKGFNSLFRSAIALTNQAVEEVSRVTNGVVASVLPNPSPSEANTVVASRRASTSETSAIPVFRKRPTWNTAFSAAMKLIKTASETIPRDIQSIRMLTDVGVPTFILPWDVECFMCISPPGEWFYPKLSYAERMFLEKKPISRTEGLYILYLHGGAFCCCNTATHREMLFRLVQHTKANVLAVDYRRPPEHPYPAPMMDCLHAYRWLLSKIDPSRIVFAGDSAGGGLVIQTIVQAVKEGLPPPAGGMLISPWVDLEDTTSDSWTRNEPYDYLPPDFVRVFSEAYRGDKTYEECSPTFLDNLECLPPMLVEVGECECLHDQIMQFVDKCRAKGVSMEVNVRKDMCHVFPVYAFTNMAECANSFAAMARFCKTVVPAVHVPKPVTVEEESMRSDSNEEEAAAAESGKWN